MRNLLTVIFFLNFSTGAFCQVSVKFKFYDSCQDTVLSLEFEAWKIGNPDPDTSLSSNNSTILVDSLGTYIIYTGLERQGLLALFDFTINIESSNIIDTLNIPTICFAVTGALHDSFWTYLNCEESCNGNEISYYSNGNKQLEGSFTKGKPDILTSYREDGTIEQRDYYVSGRVQYTKIEYYDEQGNLETYELYKNGKRRTKIRTFNSKDQLIEERIEK